MALKFKIAKLDDVEEPQRALYKQVEDWFELDVDGVDDRAELKAAKARETEARKAAEKRAKELEDAQRTAEEANRAALAEAARKAGDIAAVERSWQEKLDRSLAEVKGQYEPQVQSLSGDLNRLLVDNVAQSIASAIAIPGSDAVLMPHIKARLRTDIRDGQRVTIVVDDKGQPSALTIEDLKKEIAANKAFAPLIVGSKASGGGAGGGSGNGVPPANLKRSQMNNRQKSEYIEAHGKDAFFKLPE
jgi:hypothetical protein